MGYTLGGQLGLSQIPLNKTWNLRLGAAEISYNTTDSEWTASGWVSSGIVAQGNIGMEATRTMFMKKTGVPAVLQKLWVTAIDCKITFTAEEIDADLFAKNLGGVAPDTTNGLTVTNNATDLVIVNGVNNYITNTTTIELNAPPTPGNFVVGQRVLAEMTGNATAYEESFITVVTNASNSITLSPMIGGTIPPTGNGTPPAANGHVKAILYKRNLIGTSIIRNQALRYISESVEGIDVVLHFKEVQSAGSFKLNTGGGTANMDLPFEFAAIGKRESVTYNNVARNEVIVGSAYEVYANVA